MAKTKDSRADEMAILRAERQAEAALIEAKAVAAVNQRKAVKPDHHGDIHQRMAALRQDLIRQGARSG